MTEPTNGSKTVSTTPIEPVEVAEFFDPILWRKTFGFTPRDLLRTLERTATALEKLAEPEPPKRIKGIPQWIKGSYESTRKTRAGLQADLPIAVMWVFTNGKRTGLSLRLGNRSFYVNRLPS